MSAAQKLNDQILVNVNNWGNPSFIRRRCEDGRSEIQR